MRTSTRQVNDNLSSWSISKLVLEDVWNDLNENNRKSNISQPKAYMEELHTITAKYIRPLHQTYCDDLVFCTDIGVYGPSQAVRDFQDWLAKAVKCSREGELCANQVVTQKPTLIVDTSNIVLYK